MGPVFTAVSTLRVPAERALELEERFRGRPGLVDAFPGFVRLRLLKRRGRDEYAFVTEWATREDFVAYMKSREHAAQHEAIPEPLQAAIENLGLAVFDTVVDSGGPP